MSFTMATGTCMRPAARVPGSCRSGFAGLADSLQRLSISAPTPPRLLSTPVQARRECMLTGKTANNGYAVTFSHKRNKKLQGVNLQWKRIYWPEGQRWVRLRICTRALKTIEKNGLQSMAREAGLDLASLPYVDASPARREFLAARGTPMPPMPKDKRAMKNPEKLAASTKKPLVGHYLPGGRIKMVRAE